MKHEIIELKDFQTLSGLHCESSAMMNALNYQGIPLNESTINGYSASASFGFARKEKFPILHMRVGNLKERFSQTTGISYTYYQPKNKKEAYHAVKDVLRRNIPVILRVNMRYLPYLHGGKYGHRRTSFGWHFITLVKIDEKSGYAWVTDTTYKTPQRIHLADLAKARNSKHGQLKADNYFYYFEKPKMTLTTADMFNASIELFLKDYKEVLVEIKQFPEDIKNIEDKRNIYMLSPLFFTMYGFIEAFGTGGSGFKNFIRDYLIEMNKSLNLNISSIIEIISELCSKWQELALKFKYISENIMAYKKDKAARQYMYLEASIISEEVYKLEEMFYNELKNI